MGIFDILTPFASIESIEGVRKTQLFHKAPPVKANIKGQLTTVPLTGLTGSLTLFIRPISGPMHRLPYAIGICLTKLGHAP